jgi:hypothetical protein
MRAALRNRLANRAPALAVLAALSEPAHAHAMFGSAAPFWSGALHFLVAPLALAAVAGCIVALAGIAERAAFWAMACAALATFAGAELTAVPPAAVPLGVAGIGLVAALGWNPPLWPACVIAALAGLCAGGAVSADADDWGGSLGAALATLVLGSWGLAGLMHLQARAGLAAGGGWQRLTVLARRVLVGALALV